MVDLAQRRVAEIAGLKEALSILANDHALEGTPLRPPMGWSSWLVASFSAVAEAAEDCRVLIWNVENVYETSDWFGSVWEWSSRFWRCCQEDQS